MNIEFELKERRNLNSKHFLVGRKKNGTPIYRMDARVGHIHYKDGVTKKFEEIDVRFREEGGEFVVDKASYAIKIPKKLTKARFYANFKQLDIEPLGIKPDIEGRITDDPETDHKGNTVRFDDIYGKGIHLEFVCRTGSVKKYIVFDQKPTKFNWQFKLTGFDKSKHILRKARILDSGEKPKSQDVKYDIKGGFLTKHLPEKFFDDAVYPVRTDTTTSYYAGAGDGYVLNQDAVTPSQANWDALHDAATGTEADYTANGRVHPDMAFWQTYSQLRRGFCPVDTSGLPDGATILAAVLKLYGRTKADDYNGDGQDYAAVVQTDQPDPTELTTADYNNCGATNNPTKGSADVDISGLSTSAYNDFTLNAAGRGWISKTGWTMLGVREGHDIEDVFSDPGAANKESSGQFWNSEETDTAKDPYLSVTYTVSWIKKLSGVLQANIKEVSGVAIASVKKVAGVSNVA